MGTVSYEVHNETNGTSLMSTVNTYINAKMSNEFRGTWMLVVEWKDIPQNGDQHSNVRERIRHVFSVITNLYFVKLPAIIIIH